MFHLANELLYAPPALSRLSRGEPMRNAVVLTSLLGVALLAGCPDRTISEVSPEQGRVEYKDIPVNVSRKVDILFVIDDSRSMVARAPALPPRSIRSARPCSAAACTPPMRRLRRWPARARPTTPARSP